jgi:hypothetical protein
MSEEIVGALKFLTDDQVDGSDFCPSDGPDEANHLTLRYRPHPRPLQPTVLYSSAK